MNKRAVPVLVGALAVALLVVAAGAATGVHIPNGSIGLKKLSPHLRRLVTMKAAPGPEGAPGKDGTPGASGSPGTPGVPDPGALLTYAERGGSGPVVLSREDGSTQESIGPLTFTASCDSEGEDTIRGTFEVTSDENGITLNGEPLNQGSTRILRELVVSGGGSKEDWTLIRATNESGSFAMQGVSSYLVQLPGGCHFFGTLIEDS